MATLLQLVLENNPIYSRKQDLYGIIYNNPNNELGSCGSVETPDGVWDIVEYTQEIISGGDILLFLRDKKTGTLTMQISLKKDPRVEDLWSGTWECPRFGKGEAVCLLLIKKYESDGDASFLEQFFTK